ncbi:uncharacterized protein rab44 isoform X2 [Pleuronectes platessa]|uniref:uncharacterized protein rab44 isoform X2 n=1 Tax=Pleuronectes platessa TaxID=8262 RepID=UPI00232A1A9D|nr:uncharacterized protein rab44 isoform X2 [Pleuronectes platessa]
MSAQRTKQSLDSHRLVVNQSETPKADEFHVAGDTNVPQPEGDTGPLSVSSSSHSSQSETQPLTSANRRKLGSRRRNKQQQHVKDSATEKQDKPREELEGNTKCNEALETKQPERQEELNNQGSEHDSSVTRGSSLWSSTTSGYSCEVQVPSTKNPEDIPEILILKSGNKHADKDEKPSYSYGLVETKLEVTGAAAFLQSEEIKENTASSSDLISSLSVTEIEKRREEESDLLRQDVIVEGNYLKGESHAQSIDTRFSTTPEVTTDKYNPKQNTELADIQNENFSLHLDSQLQDCSASTKESTDTNFSTSVNRRKLGSTRRNKRRQHVKDPVTESEEEPVEKFAGFDFFETATVSSLTETDVKSVETMLEGMNRSPTDEIERKETAHVGISELNSSNFLATSSEPLMNQSNVREMPHELASLYSETNAEGKEREEDADLSKPWGSFRSSDLTNESRVKSDLVCPMNLETPTEEDHGEHTEPERFVELAIDSSPNEELSTNEEQNELFSLSEVSGPQDLYEEEVKPAEIHHSFDGANSEIGLANLTDQAEVGDSSRSESSVKGVEDSVTEQEVSKPDYKQDEPPEMQSNVEAFKQMIEDDQVYDPKKPETSDMEGLDTAFVQVYEDEGQLEDDIKPSLEQTNQEKEGVPTDMTESKSPLESAESETLAPFDSQPQDTSLIIDDQNNTDFNPISNRRKLGSSRRNKRQKIVESPGVESEMSLMLHTEIQQISMQVMQEGRDKADPSQTENVCNENQENANSSHTGLSSVSVHSSSPVEQQVTEQPNSPASTYSPVTDTESKQDTDLLMRWGFLQADNSLYETHLKAESLESSTKPEITTEKSSYREHTWPKYGIEQVADSSPKEEMSPMESQNEHLSSSEVGGAQHSEDFVEEVHNEEVKPIHMQTMHQIDDSSIEESNPCLQTLESETKSPFDSQPVDNSVIYKEETQTGFKLTGNRRKLGTSRRLKGRRHGPEITEPEEEVVENTCNDEEKTEKETVPTGTISQEELKEQTSPEFNLKKKITSAVEEQENTEEMPEEDTTLSLSMMDNRTTVTTDFLYSTEEVKEPADLTPLPVFNVVQMDLIQAVQASVWNDNSDSQNISNHDDNVMTKSVPSDVLDQEETSPIPNTESSPCDDDSAGRDICVQQTTNVNESEGDVVLNEAKSVMAVLGSEEVDVEEERKDPFNKDHLAQTTNTSIEVKPDEPFSAAQNETETFEIGPEENTRAKPAEKVGISPAADASNSRGETDNQDKTEHSNLDVEVDVRNLEVMEELSPVVTKEENAHWSLSNVDKEKEIDKTSSVHNDGQKLQSNTSDLQTIESNMIPNRDDSVALLPDQSAFHNEEFVNPATFVQGTDVRACEVDVDVSEEPTQQDNFRSNEMQTTSVVIGRRSPSINVLLPPSTEDAINTDSVIIEALQSDKQSPEGIKEGLTQEQPLISVEAPSVVVADQETLESVIQEPNNAPEGAHTTNFEMKDSNPHVSPNRRRKMGSTRRNHGSRSHVKNSHQEQTHTQSESVESSSQSEKSSYRENTEPKYGVEQVAFSSPTEEMSPMESQTEHLSSSEVEGAQHSEDVLEEVHEEEVKPIHIDDSSVEERNPCLQTLESETKSPFDSQPVDNSVIYKEETQTGFKLTGNRRKLGTSRRLKGRRHGPEITEPEEEVVENTCNDEEKTEKETVPTGTISQEELKEQTSPDFNLKKKITSAVEEQENTEEMPEEDTTLSLSMMDNRTTVTTDFLYSTEEVKEPEDLTPLPVFNVVQMDLIQAVQASVWNDNSDSQNISNHDDNVMTKSVPADVLDQEETSHIPNTESSPCDDDSAGQELCVQQTTNVNESEGDVVLNKAKSLMGALGSEEVDVEEERKDPSNEDHLAQETDTSIEVTPDEPFSVAQNETETFEIGPEENTRAKPHEKVGISPAADASNSRGETDKQDKTDQSNLDVEVDVRNLDRVEVMEELSPVVTKEENAHWSLSNVDKEKEIDKTSSVHNDGQELQSNTSDLQTIESNMIPNRDDSVALLPDQSAFHNEEFVNPAAFVQGTDVRAGEVDVDVSEEPTQQDDFRSNEMQTTSVVIGRRSPSINVLLPPSTEDAINTDSVIIEALQSDKQSPEGIKEGLTQEQPLISVEAPSVVVADQETLESVIQEPNNAPEGAHTTNSEMKDSNPHVSPNRRRKMGSTRRNHGSRSHVKNSHQEQTHTQSESVESSSQSEKSSYRENTEPKYGVEQVAFSSPTEEMSPMESQTEHLSSSEVESAQHSEDVLEEVHEEEVKPIHIDDSSVEERNPSLQTLESETKSPFDSQPVDNSVIYKEETQTGFKLTGNRRKLGTSRRLKGRRHGPEITEPEEEVVENTCIDEEKTEKETVPTGTISQEELKEQTSPEFNLKKKITSAVEEQENTEEMPEEDTTLSLSMMDNRITVTTDFLYSTEEVKEPEDLTPLPVHDVVQMDLVQAVEIASAVKDSVIIAATQSDKQSPEGIKEGLIQDQPLISVEAPSVVVADQETLESVIQEPNSAPEGAHTTNSEMKDSNPHVSPNRRRKMGSTRRNHGSQSKVENSHQEQTHTQSESVESSSQSEKSSYREHTESKYGVEQVAVSSPTEEMSTMESQNEHLSSSEVGGAQHSEDDVEEVHDEEAKPIQMQTMHQIDDYSVEERNPCLQTLESETMSPFDSQPLDNSLSIKEETQSGFKLTGNRRKLGSSRRLKGRRHGPEITEPEEEVVEDTCNDEEKTEIETVPTGTISQEELQEQTSPDFKLTKKITSAVEDSVIIETTQSDKQCLGGIKEGLIQDQPFKSVEAPSVVVSDQETVESVIQEPNNAPEGSHTTNSEMKDSNPQVSSPNRRRKMGSTRRNLGSRSKLENSHQEQTHTQSESLKSSNQSEKSNYRENTESKYGIEHVAVLSPQEETSTMESQNEHLSSSEVGGAQHSEDVVEEVHEEEVKPIHIDDSSVEERNPCLQTLESEAKSPLDSQPVDNSVSIKEETLPGFKLTGNRRKLGSSRRLKGRRHGPEITEPEEEVVENTCSDEEKTEIETVPTGTISPEELQEQTSPDFKLTPKITSAIEDSVIIAATQSDKQSPEVIKEGLIQDQPFKSVEAPSVLVSDQEMVESVIQEPNNAPEGSHTTNSEMKDSNPQVSSPNRRRKMGSTRRNLGSRSKLENSHQEQTHTQSESLKSSNQSEKSNYRENTESKYGIEHVAVLSPQEEMSTMESQNEHLSSSEVGGAQHSEDVVEEVYEEEVKPIHIDDSSVEERNPCLQTLESETKSPLDSQPVDNSVSIKEETLPGFKLTGNRRKLGSSRRLKGRRHSPEITEPEEEVVENTCSDEEKTEKETVPTGTISPEELKEQTSPDFNLKKKITSAIEDSVIIAATQSDKQSPEGIKEGLIQDQPFKSVEVPSVVVVDQETVESVIQEPNNAPEGAHTINSEMKDSNPQVSSPNRRRKMGSTRRNLGSRSKVENSNRKQDLDREDVNVGDISPESVAEKEPPINDQQESSDSEQRKEKVFETVELSHTGESQGKSPAQQTLEENPDSLSQQAETEPHLTPDHLTALSPHDVTSESAAGGRRRKMGSSRKSRGPQKDDDSMMSAQKERDAILTDESVHKTTQEHREESSGLEEKLEVDESVKQSSSGVSFSNTAEHSRPLSGKAPERGTPVQQHDAEMRLRQESQKTFSLGDSRGADIGSKRYNVMLVGDSSVGKTSLMQRAQSGKFSFEIPASIGLDTSLWTVVVDGKPVVLQLWDTAGQERFHSITRQVFHKAQAFLLMYDITCSQSFTAISYWANCIQEAAPEDVTILLLGNKSDSEKRQVNTEEGEILAKEYNFEFMECSAATGDNVIHSLETVARMLSEKDDTSEEAMVLHKEPPRSKSSGCC